MGYRSNVGCIVTCPNNEVAETMLAELIKDETINECGFIEDFSCIENNVIRFHWEDIKWYECFSEIHNFKEWLNTLEEKDCNAHFVRIGEDLDDIEELTYGDVTNWIYITRSMCF